MQQPNSTAVGVQYFEHETFNNYRFLTLGEITKLFRNDPPNRVELLRVKVRIKIFIEIFNGRDAFNGKATFVEFLDKTVVIDIVLVFNITNNLALTLL